MMRRAAALRKANDLDGAIEAYERVLDRYPNAARAHLHLGTLFDQEPKENYARAIYHYERYLALSRDEKTKRIASELLTRARWSLAASLAERAPEAAVLIGELKRENKALREEIAALQAKLAGAARPVSPPVPASRTAAVTAAAPRVATVATSVALRTAPLPRPTPEPAVVQAQTHTVQSGETLSIIAHKVYGDANAWRRIYEANKATLPSPGSVRPGQVLIIPR